MSAQTNYRRGDWVLREPESMEWLWGTGEAGYWAAGEAFWWVGRIGSGKTTCAQQVILHGLGIRRGAFLDLPVRFQPGARVLYIAADRARQIRRSMRRMVSADDADLLRRGLIVQVNAPFRLDDQRLDVGDFAGWLMSDHNDDEGNLVPALVPGDVVVIDSIKDLTRGLNSDETGSSVTQQINIALTAGIEVMVVAHPRKNSKEHPERAMENLDDMYGSTLFAAGAGSVVGLDGKPSAEFVTLHHLKANAEQMDALKLRHDHRVGTTTIVGAFEAGPTPDERAAGRVEDYRLKAIAVADALGAVDADHALNQSQFLGEIQAVIGKKGYTDELKVGIAAAVQRREGQPGLHHETRGRKYLYWRRPADCHCGARGCPKNGAEE